MTISKQDIHIYKRILSLFKPYIGKVIAIVIIMIISAAINLLLPLISKEMMDKGLLGKNIQVVIKLSVISLCLIMADQGIGFIETKYRAYINSLMSYDLFKNAFKHMLKLRISFFNNTNFAEIMNNVGMDVGNISKVSDRSIFFIVTQVFKIVGGIVGLVLIDWRLTLLVLCMIPLRYKLVKYLAQKRRKMFEDYMEYNRDFAAWYGDTIGGVKEIKLWGIQRIKIGEFIKKQRSIININIRLSLLDKLNEFTESAIFQIITSTLYVLGIYMIIGGDLTIGGLFAFVTYSVYVTAPISAILNIGYSFSNIVPSAKRLFDFMEMECEHSRKNGADVRVEKNTVKGNIRFDNISFSYNEREPLLRNISFEIKEGEKVAIIGTNGSGKSTLMSLLLRFYLPGEGRILLDGHDIQSINLRDYRKLISVVSQDLYLFNTSIKENISLFSNIDEINIHKAAKQSRAHGFIEKMPEKYDSQVGRNGSKLSGGERQKLAMARAFVRDSKILLLDEATANYDAESETQVNDLLKTELKDRTTLLITHKPDVLRQVDRIVMLEKGLLIDIGTHSELLDRNEKYRDLINTDRLS